MKTETSIGVKRLEEITPIKTAVVGIERFQREYEPNQHAGLLLRGVDASELKALIGRGAILFLAARADKAGER